MPKRTDIKSILIICFYLCAQTSHVSAMTYDIKCIEHASLLECLKYDEKENIYGSQIGEVLHEEFFAVLVAAEINATKCDLLDKTAYFLNGIRVTGNAELNQYFSEIVERDFAINRADCLLKTYPMLDKKSQQEIIFILKNPTFLDETQCSHISPLLKKLIEIENAQTH